MQTRDKIDYYEQALTLANDGESNYPRVFELLKKASSEDDARADYALATWYYYGVHVKSNRKKSFIYNRKSALAGNSDALFQLAVDYEKGNFVKKNARRALCLYMDAALRGDAQACYEVGRIYWHGLAGARDRRIAEVWLRKAEELQTSSKKERLYAVGVRKLPTNLDLDPNRKS